MPIISKATRPPLIYLWWRTDKVQINVTLNYFSDFASLSHKRFLQCKLYYDQNGNINLLCKPAVLIYIHYAVIVYSFNLCQYDGNFSSNRFLIRFWKNKLIYFYPCLVNANFHNLTFSWQKNWEKTNRGNIFTKIFAHIKWKNKVHYIWT